MKKKATSSSSERSSFQSLKEAKDFVDSSFEELLKQLDEYFNAGRPRLRVVSAQELESRRLDPDPIGTRIAFLNKGIDQLHKLQQAVLQSCSKICILDAFDESKEFFELISDQLDKRILYLQAEIDQFLVKQKNGSGDPPSIIPPAIWLPSEIKQRAERERKKIIRGLPGFLAYQNSLEQSKPKRGRRPKADLKSRDNRELLIAILLKHHRYESKDGLKIDPISTKEASQALGKSESTLSKTWEKVQPTLTYERYVKLCGHFKTLEKFLKAIDSKEGYLERSNKEGSIDRSEG